MKKILKVPVTTKIFITNSSYSHFKDRLLAKGWVENPNPLSPHFDVKVCVRAKDINSSVLGPQQIVSHFIGSHCLTNKLELSRSLSNLVTLQNVDIDTFYPRCYDLNCSSDHQNFLIDFKISACVKLLKKYQREATAFKGSNESLKAIVAVSCILRYCDFLENKYFLESIISEEEFSVVRTKNLNQNQRKFILNHLKFFKNEFLQLNYQKIKTTHKKVLKIDGLVNEYTDQIQNNTFYLNRKTPNKIHHINVDKEISYLLKEIKDSGRALVRATPSWKFNPKISTKNLKREVLPINNDSTPLLPKLPNKSISEQAEINDEQEPLELSKNEQEDSSKTEQEETISPQEKFNKILLKQILFTLDRYKNLNPQFDLIDQENIWILKPNGLSRGRGIRVFKKLEEIEGYWGAAESEMVAMKYIERPLLINKHKFDIRHWVVISNLDPLMIWSYHNYYIRLSLEEYNANDSDNVYIHLTNNSVSKKNKKLVSRIYEESMLDKTQFIQYCNSVNPEFNSLLFHKQMHKIIVSTVQAGRTKLVPRKNSYTVFGFDLMVDEMFNIWLIEVNSSPSMDTNTNVTEKVVPDFLYSLAEAIVDNNFVGNPKLALGTKIGGLKMIHKEKRTWI